MKKQTIITFVLAIFICSFAQAKVVYVNKNAPGPTYDGTSWATAFTTVQAGINAAVSGDEVWVARSTPAAEAYVENVTTEGNVALYGGFAGTETDRSQRDWTTNVTVIASPSASSDVVTSSVQGVITDGFSIRNGDYGVHVHSGTATVTNCTISGNRDGVYVSGTTIVTNCLISGNSGAGIDVSGGTATVTNCVISSNSGSGVYVYGTATVTNCTISGNGSDSVCAGSSGTTVSNSIVVFNGTGIRRTSISYSLTLSYNDVYGNTTANYSNITDPTGTNGNISVDPLLSNPYRDIHIQPGSPCRDAGNDAFVLAGWTDIDGQPRIQGAHVDIGSDESDGTTWTVPVATRFVKPTGDDGNDGLSWATAKKSIKSALAVSQGLDEVWVSAGTYTENVLIPAGVALYGGFAGTETERSRRNWSANVTVIASPNTSSDTVTVFFHGAILDGVSFQNGYDGIAVSSGTAMVTNCNIIENYRYGVYAYNAVATLTNCSVRGNGISGVFAYDAVATVSNCTISGNSTIGVYLSGGTTTLANCIVAFNSWGIYRANTSNTMVLSFNDVYGNTTDNFTNITDPTGTDGNISSDPLFISRTGQNYRLQENSPCIDTGDDSLVPTGQTDLDGRARIQGAHVDMGAYEFTAVTPLYTLSEAVGALKVGAGLLAVPPEDKDRLDLDSDNLVTSLDAARIARKAAGLDANP